MTCLISAYHASSYRHRNGILRYGLLPNRPANGRPYGVYVFTETGDFDHPTFSRGGRCRWSHGFEQDLWHVGYFGPIVLDAYVENALIFLEAAPLVTLVMGNN